MMMEATSTSEMLVNFYQTTWCHNPEVSLLHTGPHEIQRLRKLMKLIRMFLRKICVKFLTGKHLSAILAVQKSLE
jgi:hypothetical protein